MKPTWNQAWEYAKELHANTPAAGEIETMKASYTRVAKNLKMGRGGLYNIPLPIRTEVSVHGKNTHPEQTRKRKGPSKTGV
jgi:hypothetical protein